MTGRRNGTESEHVGTVIIGGDQAGLATGYYLGKQHRSLVILEANPRSGDSDVRTPARTAR